MTVTIYTNPASRCQSCEATAAWLTRAGVPFDVLPLTDEVLSEVDPHRRMRAYPVVVHAGRVFSGFRIDRLQQIAAEYKEKK